MKHFLLFFFIGILQVSAQVGIGTTNPSAASMLEISSKSSDGNFKGLMPPRVTVAQRDLIDATEDDTGLMVFVNDLDATIFGLQVWNGTFWENIYLLQSSLQPTEVSFTLTETSQSESDAGIDLEFNITNPSASNGLTITVAASSYNDLVESVAQVITIPPDRQVFKAISIFSLIDDTEVEGNEHIVFSITNASGGSGAPTIGVDSVFDLTVVDNDVSVWINEIHYDNVGGDVNERIEIAGSAGIDLTGYRLVHYNGSGGTIISTKFISGIILEISNGLGVKNINFSSLQNGPDAIALVDPSGNVIQFLSYEGEVTATEGPASGMTATLLPIDQDPEPSIGFSMQLTGAGNSYEDFIWDILPDTIDEINSGQTFN
ncbi:lamin tail domain-containing protein [Leeuwenhoekiella marinoflava]|uniref:lamin tail domain-containing protein n=1 Tax=Leeuwenhoekiella marinoflava TaxID=988 RepID=UPI00300244F4